MISNHGAYDESLSHSCTRTRGHEFILKYSSIFTYSRIALIKLDFPVPELPEIAMFTSTSRQPSSLFLKNSSMFETPFSST